MILTTTVGRAHLDPADETTANQIDLKGGNLTTVISWLLHIDTFTLVFVGTRIQTFKIINLKIW